MNCQGLWHLIAQFTELVWSAMLTRKNRQRNFDEDYFRISFNAILISPVSHSAILTRKNRQRNFDEDYGRTCFIAILISPVSNSTIFTQ